MKTFITIIFCAAAMILCCVMVSFIPIPYIGDIIIKEADKHNIELTTNTAWYINPFGLKSMVDDIKYTTTINNVKITGRGKFFTYGIIKKNIYVENLSLDIHLNKEDTVNNLLADINKQLADQHYSINIKDLIINIYVVNQNNESSLNDQLILNNVKLDKQKNFLSYQLSANIDKDRSATFLLSIDNYKKNNQELNIKIENDNIYCHVYDAQKGGQINCSITHIPHLIEDLGLNNFNDQSINNLLNKYISLQAQILHDVNEKDTFTIEGKININNDSGDIKYAHADRLLSIYFDNLDLDTIVDNANTDFMKKNINNDVLIMSGKENKIISNTQKKDISENLNSFSKIALYAIGTISHMTLNTKITCRHAVFGGIKINNLKADLSKTKNDAIHLNNISAVFGKNTNNTISIRDSNDKTGNLLIYGDDVNEFVRLFNITTLNPNIQFKSFELTGKLKLSINSISLHNAYLSINGNKIINYSISNSYSFDKKNITKEKQIFINNANINEYFNLAGIYATLYDEFNSLQQNEKQDAIFWKILFEKRNRKNISDIYKTTISIQNSTLYNKRIDNLTAEYENTNSWISVNMITTGSLANGKFTFNIKNINDRETFNSQLSAKNIDINFNNAFFEDIKKATNRTFKDIFYEDKDYNIPSFFGINGTLNADINNLSIDNKTYENINGTITMSNGVIEANNFKLKYRNGDISANLALSLQGRPDMQLAFAGSGFHFDDIIKTPLDGFISLQCNLKSFGFNPVRFVQNINGKGKILVQNIKIPNFDLLHLSSEVIMNGIRQNYNYKALASKNSLAFAMGEGNLLIENGIIKGDLTFSRELVSGSAAFDYNFLSNLLQKISGSFAIMMAKKRFSTPFPIYIPFACNGKPSQPNCITDWQQLDDTIASIYPST